MSLYNDLTAVLTPYANKIKQNEFNINLALSLEGGGAPTVVSNISDMTNTNQIYVLSTDGHWYYYDGSVWTSGGEYGAVATDTTLTQPGMPADAKAVGDALAEMGESDLIPTPATGALIHNWDLTQGLTDSVGGSTATLHNATQGAGGLTIASSSAYAEFPDVWGKNRIIEVDVADFVKGVSGTGNARLLTFVFGTGTVYDKGLVYRGQTSNWDWYYPSWVGFSSGKSPDAISGKTIRLVIADDYTTAVYFGSDIVGITNKNGSAPYANGGAMGIGSSQYSAYTCTITGVRVYQDVRGGA